MFKINHLGNLVLFCIVTLILSSLTPDILPQSKDKTTNWPEPVFEHFTVAEGLPENSVRCILQDHLGYMWFGTQNGLVRYDGYNMKVYLPEPNDSLSISYRDICSIYEDKSGTLWIGTPHGGLNRFNRAAETFTRFIHSPNDSTSVTSNYVLNINEDKEGRLFIGTDKSLDLFNPQSGSFKSIYTQDKIYLRAFIEDSLTGNFYVAIKNRIMIYDPEKEILKKNDGLKINFELGNINSFFQSNDGSIWIGHSGGLAKFNSLRNTIENYQLNNSDKNRSENNILNLTEDKNGFIWATNGYQDWETALGLICFDPQLEKFKKFRHNDRDKNDRAGNRVWSIYYDHTGILWIGTWGYGLDKWDSRKQKFKLFTHDPADPQKNRFNTVYSISEDPAGVIWFTTNKGIYSFNSFSNKFNHYKFDSKNNGAKALYIENSNTIWFGADGKGLGKFNPSNVTFKFYSNDPDDSTTISNNDVHYIQPDGKYILWLGTAYGLNKFDKSSGKFIRYVHDPNNNKSISSYTVFQVLKDRNGTFWMGTNEGGLNKFNSADGTFNSFQLTIGSRFTTVIPIYEDKKGNFWIGTYRSGLHFFDREKETSVYNITEKDGLANNLVSSILEDDKGNLWIGTNNGLSKFNPKNKDINNYYNSGGFESNSYYPWSSYKTSAGEMLFGTFDGFIMFHPDSIKDDPIPPQVVISNVSLFNEPDKKLKFNGFISELKELNLSYNENDLRFDYVGLHYGDPSKNRYKYMLEGFDDDWVDAGTQRNATYTNLDAGEYVFRVKACNCDGVWNEEGASLKIIIPPPFWATWWAYTLYVLFGLFVLYSIRRYELNRTYLKNQVKLDEVKLKEREETDRMKSRFFANISHEFRTPLTLILGPSENIITEAPSENATKQAGAIKRNANRLLALINQLLDLSKLEAGKLELKASKGNIVPFIKGITMSFESVAEGKDIPLKVKSSGDEIELYFDKEKMTKIMTNLLSNAFKFTQYGGNITVSINEGDNAVKIKVKDTGQGIPEEELPKLFDRFYQVDSSQTREHEGTGIGLALTKELVELHHGTITVDSKLGNPDKVGTGWTEFTVTLPIGRKHLKDEEIIEESVILTPDKVGGKNLIEPLMDDFIKVDSLPNISQHDSEVNDDKNIVLVVEDNADVREFIKDSLGSDFQIEEASNGEQGVRKAEQIIPDLIISDIMMPKMDGNELTKRLKNDEKTSHIPIILLTAKSEQQSKLEGLETGADDYLTKPFDTKELLIRINNLISIRRKLREKYSKGDFVPVKKSEEKKLSNLEEKFMSKVLEVIENHLSEEEFSIEEFGKEVGMSRMQLHRKLKALSGKSASNYLRSVRLNKAKKMIEEQKGNISEIAYSVGFASPQYFTRSFKEEFGFPPSDVLEQRGNRN